MPISSDGKFLRLVTSPEDQRSKAREVLKLLEGMPCQQAMEVLSMAYDEIEANLIERKRAVEQEARRTVEERVRGITVGGGNL